MTDERFRLLVVCHANICRSPMAERLALRTLAARLGGDAAGFEVVSAGTHARGGRPMHLHAMKVLREHGADETGFRSRPVTAELVSGADLVLTATRLQRAACVTLDPGAVRRTFTLLQFGRLAGAMPAHGLTAISPPPARLATLVDKIQVVRGELPVGPVAENDLGDPVNEPLEGFRRTAREIQRVVDTMVDLIAPI